MEIVIAGKELIKMLGEARCGWYISVIPAFRRLRQAGPEFEDSLGNIVRPCLKKEFGKAWSYSSGVECLRVGGGMDKN